MLGLRCFVQTFSSCSEQGSLLHGLLIAVASRGGAWGLEHAGSIVVSHRFSCPEALAGVFLSTVPPGKPSVMSDSVTPRTVAHQAPLSMGFSRKNTGVGCHPLLQGLFPTQESNPGLPHCRRILYQLTYKEALTDVSYYLTGFEDCSK